MRHTNVTYNKGRIMEDVTTAESNDKLVLYFGIKMKHKFTKFWDYPCQVQQPVLEEILGQAI
jgi:hypothetical protein